MLRTPTAAVAALAVLRANYPQQQRYLARITLPRAGRWKVCPLVTRHVRDTFGFDVRARRPVRL